MPFGERAGMTAEDQVGATFGLTLHLEVMPSNRPRSREGLQCLVCRLFRRDARGDVHRGTRLSFHVLPFARGEKPLQHPVSQPVDHPFDPGDVDQIDPHTDQLHRAHSACTGRWSRPGTGK